ncbi:MAG: poly(R)-hydroxyalkanoic acid synthase subunit PhaE [Tissierellia bacterium]|nr:poly(R)-hydroxyalkanoic acid synthase subunit PhaE [Tissierellia bacterium]
MEMNNPMFEMMNWQKKYFDFWKKSMDNMGYAAEQVADQSENMAQEAAKNMNPFKMFQNMGAPMNPLAAMANVYPSFDYLKSVNETQAAIMDMYQSYNKLYEENVQPTQEEVARITEEMVDKGFEAYEQFVLPVLPEPMKSLVRQSVSTTRKGGEEMKRFWAPWMDNFKPMNDALVRGTFDNPNAFLEFLNGFKSDYAETFKKLLNMPAMGINRNLIEEQYKLVDNYISLMIYQMEVMVVIGNTTNENIKLFIRNVIDRMKNNEPMYTAQEFYNGFGKSISRGFDVLFASDEFSKLLGQFAEAYMDMKISNNKLLEKFLQESLPVPTNMEVKSLYETVYRLKRQVYELEQEVKGYRAFKEETEKALAALKEEKKTTTRRTTSRTTKADDTKTETK